MGGVGRSGEEWGGEGGEGGGTEGGRNLPLQPCPETAREAILALCSAADIVMLLYHWLQLLCNVVCVCLH